jgi:ubiquinone/menaquinone biosynthesis C-methylase UbiE
MEAAEYRRMAEVEESHWWYRATRSLLRQVLVHEIREYGTSLPLRFLDAGCGTGATGSWLSEFGSVSALDCAPEALRIYAERHPEAELLEGDISKIELPDESMDAVLCVTVLYHDRVTQPEKAVRELSRVVRPGGLICLLEPGIPSMRRGHDRETHTARRFSKRGLEHLARGAGLEIVRATGVYSFLVPPAWLKAKLERQKSSSDLDSNTSGVLGLFELLAWCERQLLRCICLPFGLSVLVIARKPVG